MSAMTIDIHEFQTRLIELMPYIRSGNELIITQAQKPVMRLVPIKNNKKQRVAGLHEGMGWVSDDFDDPLPDEFWAGSA